MDLKKAQTEINTILKKYNCKLTMSINFPQYNPEMLPDNIKLALNIITSEKFETKFSIVKNKP